jgi:hypothetical protein
VVFADLLAGNYYGELHTMNLAKAAQPALRVLPRAASSLHTSTATSPATLLLSGIDKAMVK